VKVLVDTHAFLCAITDDPQLSPRAREIFIARANDLFLSVASLWEIVIKVQIDRLRLPKPVIPYLRTQLAQNNIHVLPITLDHIAQMEALPLHHRDPFDRILVAQSLQEDWFILSADPLLAAYGAKSVW
jgi:PIN domain nuclease of toxin-antitoxin system